jgi:hypothetical protein
VPGQWQGTYRDQLEIIGDKKGGTTAAILAKKPEELDRVRDLVKGKDHPSHRVVSSLLRPFSLLTHICHLFPVPIKLVHVIRNPYDAMATHTKRKGDTSSDSDWFRKFMQRYSNISSIRVSVCVRSVCGVYACVLES